MVHLKKVNRNQIITIGVVSLGLILYLFFEFYLNRTEKVYSLKKIDSKTKITDISEYVIRNGDTVFHGKFNQYNEKGNKIAEGQFLNGNINGICSYYYDNGKIESVFYRKNSKITLESLYYYPNGKIRKYVMCNYFGEPKFIIEFNESDVQRYTGYATYPVKQYKLDNKKQIEIKTGNILNVGDVIKYDYLLANIPYTKRTFKIETEGIDNSKVNRTIIKEKPAHIIVEEVLTKKGLNRIKAITQYTFDDKVTPIKNDTVSFDVNVK